MTSRQKARAARWWTGLSVALALLGAGACGSDPKQGTKCTSDCDAGDDGGDIGSNAQTLIKGRVFDADTGKAIGAANIKTDGADMKSDADGYFELPAPKDGAELEVSKDSYTAKTQSAPRAGYVEVFIKSDDRTLEFDAEKGTKVKLDSGASIEFPPSVIVDKDGAKVTGTVKLKVSDIDGAEPKQALALPSQGKAKAADGTLGKVSIERALSIKVLDQDGNELSVDPAGKTIAELPVGEADAAAEGQGFSYDETMKQWVEEEPVVRTLSDDGEVVYQKSIRHLSWHGYGKHFSRLTCARLCVRDAAQAPIAGAQVWALGVSFPGVLSFTTGDDGCSTEDLPVSQELQLVARDDNGVSSTLLWVTSDDELPAADAPNECPAAPALTLVRAQRSPCPSGYEECGSVCIDTRISPRHCGGCDEACGGSPGRMQACIAGQCACPGRKTACGSGADLACANLDADPAHCGDCDTACAQNEACVAGECVTTSCAQPLTRCGRECVDLATNQSNCGACGEACSTDEVCLGECIPTNSPTLCSVNTNIVCDDNAYCNGVEVCDPTSSLATANGCVSAQPPCAVAQCDEELDTCSDPTSCEPTTYVTQQGRCASSVSTCLANVGTGNFALSNAILCGAADQTPASGTDELGAPYDCESCIRNDLMVCAAYYGCDAEASALDCCVQTTTCTNTSCIAELCAAEVTALSQCLSQQPEQSRCLDFIAGSVCMAASSVPTINSFSGPAEACDGSIINLSYDFSGGNALLLPNEVSLPPGAGQRQVTLQGTTTYTLSMYNPVHGSVSAQTTVNAISGPDLSLTAPTTAAHGETELMVSVPEQSGLTYDWSIVSGDAYIISGQESSQALLDIGATGTSVTVQVIATSSQTGCSTTRQRVINLPCSAPLLISYDRSAAPGTSQLTPVNMNTRPPAFAANGVVWAPYLTQKVSSANHDANFARVVGGAYDAPASSPVTFNATAATVYYEKVATDDAGNAVFVWTESSDASKFDVKLRAFRAGTGWLTEQTVGLGQANNQHAPASVVMHPTNGTAVIAWMGPPYPGSVPHVRSYSLTTDTLGTDTPLQAENGNQRPAEFSGMSLATDAQLNGFVTWFEFDGEATSLNAVHLTAGVPDEDIETGVIVDVLASGGSDEISSQSMVSQTAAYEVKTVTGSPNGHFAVLWPNYAFNEQAQAYTGTLSVRRYFNGDWGARETVATRSTAFSNVDFAIDNQGDMILAARSHGAGDHTFASGVHGGEWSNLRVLTAGGLSTLSYVTLDPSSGRGAVTFRDAARPSPYPLVAARYDPVSQLLSPNFVVDNPSSQSTSDSGRPFLAPDGTLSVVFAQMASPPPQSGDSAHLYLTTCP